MKKTALILFLLSLCLSACKLDTMLGYETVPPEALYTITMPPTSTPGPTYTPTLDPNVTPSPVPTLGLGSTKISPEDGMTMIYIPEGVFEMGSANFDKDERPVHPVYLDAYWIDQTEITCTQFLKFVDETGYKKSGFSAGHCDQGGDHPIRANWKAAQAYCQWAGRRLPTEAEWERAARGGLEGKKYPWGDQAPVCQLGAPNGAMFYDGENCFVSGTVPVKSYQPNDYGLYDVAGNASEWVADWYSEDYYDQTPFDMSPFNNPQGPEDGIFRVFRGGSYSTDSNSLRTANREGMPGQNHFGFRCAADAP